MSPDKINDYGIFDEKLVGRLIGKFERRMPQEIGYRDNMLMTFILSCQMVNYWISNPKKVDLDGRLKMVEKFDY